MRHSLERMETDSLMQELRRAGWSLGEVGTTGGWLVTGTNGENVIHAKAADALTGRRRAREQALSLGMVGRARR